MGRRIRSRREELGMSLRELARRCELVPSHLSKIERDATHEIRTDTLRKLAYHLSVTTDWLVGPYEEKLEAETELAAASV
jgi:transcriptional regulator with XRE-family HTH domain